MPGGKSPPNDLGRATAAESSQNNSGRGLISPQTDPGGRVDKASYMTATGEPRQRFEEGHVQDMLTSIHASNERVFTLLQTHADGEVLRREEDRKATDARNVELVTTLTDSLQIALTNSLQTALTNSLQAALAPVLMALGANPQNSQSIGQADREGSQSLVTPPHPARTPSLDSSASLGTIEPNASRPAQATSPSPQAASTPVVTPNVHVSSHQQPALAYERTMPSASGAPSIPAPAVARPTLDPGLDPDLYGDQEENCFPCYDTIMPQAAVKHVREVWPSGTTPILSRRDHPHPNLHRTDLADKKEFRLDPKPEFLVVDELMHRLAEFQAIMVRNRLSYDDMGVELYRQGIALGRLLSGHLPDWSRGRNLAQELAVCPDYGTIIRQVVFLFRQTPDFKSGTCFGTRKNKLVPPYPWDFTRSATFHANSYI